MIYPDDPLAAAIIREAQLRIPILENPPLSNRSPEIDAMCRAWGVPLASYWCALFKADVWKAAGAETPPIKGDSYHPAIADTWRRWALETGRFSPTPALGYGVLYGTAGKEPAHHVGVCVVSVKPVALDIEGNTSGAGFDRNGELATIKLIDTSRVIGYVSPRPLA